MRRRRFAADASTTEEREQANSIQTDAALAALLLLLWRARRRLWISARFDLVQRLSVSAIGPVQYRLIAQQWADHWAARYETAAPGLSDIVNPGVRRLGRVIGAQVDRQLVNAGYPSINSPPQRASVIGSAHSRQNRISDQTANRGIRATQRSFAQIRTVPGLPAPIPGSSVSAEFDLRPLTGSMQSVTASPEDAVANIERKLVQTSQSLVQSTIDGLKRQVDTMTSTIQQAALAELPVDRLIALVEETEAAKRPVQITAREAEATLVAVIQTESFRAAGVDRAVWVTRRDDRVRPTHRARDGRTYDIDKGLDGIFPGQEYLCRCVGVPVPR